MIRLSDAVLDESARRGSAPLEPFLLGLRFQLWPLFQKQMNENIESLKKLADGGQSGAFGGMFGTAKAVVKDEDVDSVSYYVVIFHPPSHASCNPNQCFFSPFNLKFRFDASCRLQPDMPCFSAPLSH
jgi:hypothetical protein